MEQLTVRAAPHGELGLFFCLFWATGAAIGGLTSITTAWLTQRTDRPNRDLGELRTLAHQGGMNFLLEFGKACRRDLGMCGEKRRAAPSRG
jgi:hypothetical protein